MAAKFSAHYNKDEERVPIPEAPTWARVLAVGVVGEAGREPAADRIVEEVHQTCGGRAMPAQCSCGFPKQFFKRGHGADSVNAGSAARTITGGGRYRLGLKSKGVPGDPLRAEPDERRPRLFHARLSQ